MRGPWQKIKIMPACCGLCSLGTNCYNNNNFYIFQGISAIWAKCKYKTLTGMLANLLGEENWGAVCFQGEGVLKNERGFLSRARQTVLFWVHTVLRSFKIYTHILGRGFWCLSRRKVAPCCLNRFILWFPYSQVQLWVNLMLLIILFGEYHILPLLLCQSFPTQPLPLTRSAAHNYLPFSHSSLLL